MFYKWREYIERHIGFTYNDQLLLDDKLIKEESTIVYEPNSHDEPAVLLIDKHSV